MAGYRTPTNAASSPSQLHTLVSVFRREHVKKGMLGVTFSFAGYAIFFTFLRPFLENITHASVAILTIILLFYGAANFFGAIIARFMIDKNLSFTMVAMSFAMSIVTALLIFLGGNMILASLFIAVWGFAFGSVQMGWPTWITLEVTDEAESGGSVLVATTQLAITLGAGLGRLISDHVGIEGTFGLGSLVWLCAAWAIGRAMKGWVWKADLASGMVHL